MGTKNLHHMVDPISAVEPQTINAATVNGDTLLLAGLKGRKVSAFIHAATLPSTTQLRVRMQRRPVGGSFENATEFDGTTVLEITQAIVANDGAGDGSPVMATFDLKKAQFTVDEDASDPIDAIRITIENESATAAIVSAMYLVHDAYRASTGTPDNVYDDQQYVLTIT